MIDGGKMQATENEMSEYLKNVKFLDNRQIVAFDVDQTLVMWDDNPYEPGPGKLKFIVPANDKTVYLRPHEKHLFILKGYKTRGFQVIIWSAAGVEWTREIIKVLELEKYVDYAMNKFCAYVDDLPADQILGQHLYFKDSFINEIWKDCIGYEGRYQVSNNGQVRRINQFGDYIIKELQIANDGYIAVQIGINGKNKREYVHRLVAKAFIPEIPGKHYVNHIDGVRYNNNLYNLEWVTSSENSQKRINKSKLDVSGENSPQAKIKADLVEKIYMDLKLGKKVMEIARKYKTTRSIVGHIKYKKAWKTLTDKLDK